MWKIFFYGHIFSVKSLNLVTFELLHVFPPMNSMRSKLLMGVRCTIKIFRGGEGVVDGEGGSSEGCLKWGGGGGGH